MANSKEHGIAKLCVVIFLAADILYDHISQMHILSICQIKPCWMMGIRVCSSTTPIDHVCVYYFVHVCVCLHMRLFFLCVHIDFFRDRALGEGKNKVLKDSVPEKGA